MEAIFDAKYIRTTVKFMQEICETENADQITIHINLKGKLSLRILEKLSVQIDSREFTLPVSQANIYSISAGALADFVYKVNTPYIHISVNNHNIMFQEMMSDDIAAIAYNIPSKMLLANVIKNIG